MQEGHLFAGSIAENISFFDEHATKQNIEDAAELASIHGGIVARSMGSMLSGGQRIPLARALYRKPKLLLLDEATSSLDIQHEGMMNEAIRALPMTRVIIAHRRETFGSADRILLLGTRHENHEIEDITAALKTEPVSATPVMA
ncbi:ATP-binding cassette domain-containing protein [Dyella acidisoli]